MTSKEFASARGRALWGFLSFATLTVCALASASPAAPPVSQRGDESPRAVIAAAEALPPGGIDELRTVEIGGVPQWLSIRGANRSNPILLFIHGGPGAPIMPESWTFQRPWEDYFTVVQWDQRGAGKTFSAAHRTPDKVMTVAQLESDTDQVITWLRHRYHKRKIFILGLSFGSVLGLRVAIHHPDWLYAYIGVGQVVNAYQNEAVGYRETLARAEAVHDRAAITALQSIAPYPNLSGPTPISKTAVERKWDVALGGMLYGRTSDDGPLFWSLSPDYTAYDVESAKLGESASAVILLRQLWGINFDADLAFKCPVIFFAGEDDRTTPESLVAAYYARIHAPLKKFLLIRNAAHYVVNEAPGIVLMDLVRYARPLDTTAVDARH
ncbi:MAG TPA: alpha/beta hydrolase [Steroidobacteraceae bacterium]|jgi:pimeloyl-ACP methyl ester carboxylesterase